MKPQGEHAPDHVALVAEVAHIVYYESQRTWLQNTWCGVPCWQSPQDLYLYQKVILEQKPRVIIQTGVAHGGSILFMAHMLDILGDEAGEVIGIDIDLSNVDPVVLEHPRVRLIKGSSADLSIAARLDRALIGPTMVSLDSDHRAAHVAKELSIWAPLVSPGQFLVVEDTNVNGHPVRKDHGPGPAEALAPWIGAQGAIRDWVKHDELPQSVLFSFHTWLQRTP